MNRKTLYTLGVIVILFSMVLAACQPAAPATTQAPAATQAAAAPTEAPAATQAVAATTAAPAATEAAAATTEAAAATTEAAAATTAPTVSTAGKNTVIIGTTDKIASLDSADAYAVRDWELIKNISQGLLRWKPGTADLEPALATDMPQISEDGLTYTLTLKDGIKFADGTPLDAKMYADQLNRLLTIGPSCPNAVADALVTPYVKSITAPDAKTIVFTLKNKVGYFSQILASPPYVASDPKSFPADKCNLFPPAPIYGVGPWFISQYTQGEQIVLQPNPNYTGDLKPQVDQVIVRDFADPQTMSLAVQNGEIDIAWRFLSPEQITPLQKVSGLTVGTVKGGGTRFLILNHAKKPMDDLNVDKAIASAIDRNELADTVFGGNVTPLYSMVPPGFLGATEAFDTMYTAPNLDAAKKFLEASGYTASNPLKFELWYPPEHYGASTAAAMELIKKQLEATGAMQVTLKSQEWSTYVTALTEGNTYPAGILGWFFDYPDSSNYLDPFVYNGGEGNNVSPAQTGTDYGKPINDKINQLVTLLNQADSESDQDKRAQLYQQAQDIYADQVASVPLFFVPEHVVYRSNIKGNSNYGTPETLNIGPTIEFSYSMISKTP
jgi:peptide/nickel transport system substrate-binding protein